MSAELVAGVGVLGEAELRFGVFLELNKSSSIKNSTNMRDSLGCLVVAEISEHGVVAGGEHLLASGSSVAAAGRTSR